MKIQKMLILPVAYHGFRPLKAQPSRSNHQLVAVHREGRTPIGPIHSETGTNYKVTWQMINTAEHGVPQIRERAFIVGSRDGREFRFPEATFTAPAAITSDLFARVEPYRTAWDALGDLAEPNLEGLKVGGKWGDLLPSIPEGANYLWHTDRGGGQPLFGWQTRYWSFLLTLSKRLPSWTAQANVTLR